MLPENARAPCQNPQSGADTSIPLQFPHVSHLCRFTRCLHPKNLNLQVLTEAQETEQLL